MNNDVLNIAVIVNVIPRYREGFYDRLFSRTDMFVKVYCQDKIPGMNLINIHNKYANNVNLLKFISAKRDKLSWQFIPWYKIFNDYDIVFIEGNPRNLSHALLASILRIFRKKVVLWTMAHSFRANTIAENVRLLWSRNFNYLFVYTDAEVDYLRRKGFTKNYILGMNNGLDQKNIDVSISKWPAERLREWRILHNYDKHSLILTCARLENKNKFEQVVQALPAIVDKVPNLIWCVIGGGSEEDNLKYIIDIRGLSNHVHFVGELYNEEDLAPWFLSAELLIHPAAIGLTMLHAFGYGLPVITHGDSKLHGPEYAAFETELTGRNFRENDVQNMAETVVTLIHDIEARSRMKKYVLRVAREKYNADVMVERFVKIANIASNA